MKKNTKKILQALGAYQIFGGILGIGLAVRIMSRLTDSVETDLAIAILPGLFYLFSIACGFILFRNYKLGLKLSLLNQVLQVLSIAVGSFAYNYVAGFKLGFGIDFVPAWQIKLNLSLSSFQFVLNAPTGRAFIGVNLLALILIYLMERLREELK